MNHQATIVQRIKLYDHSSRQIYTASASIARLRSARSEHSRHQSRQLCTADVHPQTVSRGKVRVQILARHARTQRLIRLRPPYKRRGSFRLVGYTTREARDPTVRAHTTGKPTRATHVCCRTSLYKCCTRVYAHIHALLRAPTGDCR